MLVLTGCFGLDGSSQSLKLETSDCLSERNFLQIMVTFCCILMFINVTVAPKPHDSATESPRMIKYVDSKHNTIMFDQENSDRK